MAKIKKPYKDIFPGIADMYRIGGDEADDYDDDEEFEINIGGISDKAVSSRCTIMDNRILVSVVRPRNVKSSANAL